MRWAKVSIINKTKPCGGIKTDSCSGAPSKPGRPLCFIIDGKLAPMKVLRPWYWWC
jgi:hypothetical protein